MYRRMYEIENEDGRIERQMARGAFDQFELYGCCAKA